MIRVLRTKAKSTASHLFLQYGSSSVAARYTARSAQQRSHPAAFSKFNAQFAFRREVHIQYILVCQRRHIRALSWEVEGGTSGAQFLSVLRRATLP